MERGIGRTTQQMKDAPSGSVFVWVNNGLRYPRNLAASLSRRDLLVISPGALERGVLRGYSFPSVIVDHAAELSNDQRREFLAAICRTTETQPNGRNQPRRHG